MNVDGIRGSADVAAKEKDIMISRSTFKMILDSIHRGNCCLVIGPRYRGKSQLIRRAAEELAQTGFYRLAYISMGDITQTEGQEFYRALYNTIHSQVTGEEVAIQADIYSANDLRNAMLDLIAKLEYNLLLQIDDLELAPPNLISLLLGTIRSVFTTVANQSGPRLQAIVSGTINLHQLALPGISRFESISDLILVDDMSLEESRSFATGLFSNEGIHISTEGLDAFLEQTSSDQVLIKLLAGTCIELLGNQKEVELTADLIPRAVSRILRHKPNFEVKEALSEIEGDPDLLSCFLEIAERGEMQVNELPLQTVDNPNALDLCGVFRRTNQGYLIKSPLWRSILERHFSSAHCGRLYTVAGYWRKAIKCYEKAIHKDKIEKKSDLFGATINGMQASEDDRQALEVLAIGMHACYPNCEIGIYLCTESVLRLAHFSPGKSTSDKPPRQEIRLDDHASPEVEALLGPDYSKISQEQKTRFLIPLRVRSGANATGLVSYCGDRSSLDKHVQHEEILQMISFLHQATRAIDGRRKYSNALHDAKSHAQTLESLDYMLTSVLNHLELDDEVIFRLLLAGLTANECLGFNRAALFLIDDHRGELVGTMGVGHLTWEEADYDWKNFPHHSLDNLLAALMAPNYKYTPLHAAVKSVRFPISDGDVFGRVHREGMARQSKLLTPVGIDNLPSSFLEAVDPAVEFVVAPLAAGTRRLGLVYVDNKYTHRPIDGFRMASLTNFLTQVSIVIANAKLFETEKETREYLDLLIGSSQDGIIAVDNQGWVIRYSEGAQKILGYSLGEVKQKRVDELYGSLKIAQDINKMLIVSDRVRDYQTTILDKDNNRIPVVLSASLLRDKTGNPIGSVGFFKDLRDLKKVENNLRMILDTVSIMSKANHSEAGLSALAKRIVTAQSVTFCSILLLDETKHNIIMKVAYPNPRPLSMEVKWKPATGEKIPLAQAGILTRLVNLSESQVFQHGQMIDGMDVIQHIQQYVLLDEKIQSLLIVPLKAGNEVSGVCIVGETRGWSRSALDKDKVEIVSSMVTQGTIFVDRLNAHESTQNKLIMVERLRSIGDDLVAATPGSAKSILDKVVRAACDVTGASSALIYPWDNQMRAYDTEKIAHFGLHKRKSFSEKTRDEVGSMTSIVIKKGIIIVDDIRKGLDRSGKTRIWADRGGFLDNEGVQAFVGVSLRVGEKRLGVLFVNFLEPHYFGESELEVVNLFANQAVIAIENARLYEDLALKLEESSTLQKVGILLAETRDSNMVLDRVMQAAMELIHADSGNILFYDESKHEFLEDALMSPGIGLPLQQYKTRVRQHSGYSFEIIKNSKPIRILDTKRDPRVNPATLEKGRGAVLGVPLIGRDNPVGVLWVNWKTARRISEEEENLLMALASQAAVSIENVRLFNSLMVENVRRNEESKALQEVSTSFTEPMGINKGLYRVLQAALKLVEGDEDSILFYDEARDEFDTNALMCSGLDQPVQTYQSKVRQQTGLAYQIVKERKPVFISDTFLDSRISQVSIDKGRRATVGVPLMDDDGPVGVLWVNWKATRIVSSRDASLLTALASLATLAIKGFRRYAEIQRRSAHLVAVHEAGKVISAASIGLSRQDVLDSILEQAIEYVTGVDGWKASVGTIQLLDEETNELVVKSVFPRQYPQSSIAKFDHISLDPKKSRNGGVGITGRAVRTQRAQLVLDVSKDDDYIIHNEDTKSELAIPMMDNGRVIGVMDMESPHLDAFDELDKDSLSLLVDLAVVALHNTEQAEQLTRSNAVGLMGAWGAEIVHDINREVGYIRRDIKYLRQQPGLSEVVMEVLGTIDECAEHLALPEIPERLPGFEAAPSALASNLDSAIHSAVEAYRSGNPSITIHFEPGCPEIRVAMHERFVLAMVRNLFRNSGFALSRISNEKVIYVRSRVEGSMAVFEIEDSGPGLRPDVIPYLFKRLIPHRDGRKGRGLLLVGFIVQQHGGRIEIVPNEGKGGFFRFWLPLAPSEEKTAQTD